MHGFKGKRIASAREAGGTSIALVPGMKAKAFAVLLLVMVSALFGAAACSTAATGGVNEQEGAADQDGTRDGVEDQGHEEPGTATGLPCNIDKILKERCQSCHGTNLAFGAPNPLVTYADLQVATGSGEKTYQRVLARIKDDTRPMPQAPNPRLTAEETSAVEKWVADGAPASSDRCDGNVKVGETAVKPLSCKPDVSIRPPTKWTMPKNRPDVYACVGFDYTAKEKRHITALAAHVDNKKILHHVLLMESPTKVSETPFECGATVSSTWKYITGWAPGGDNMELPPEAGFPAKKGTTHYVLQLHYNNAKALEGETDASGYDFCTTDKLRDNDAGSLVFGSMAFAIPPRSTKKIKCDYVLPAQFKGVKIIQTWPHMHEFGTSLSTEHVPAGGGAPKTIVSQPNFSFADQHSYPASTNVAPLDIIRTRCTWKNTSDKTITWGEGTGDEMCFNFTSYYPNIPDVVVGPVPIFSWVTPSLTAACVDE
jgi:mono/diheme cytochrome c family protein